MRQTLLSAALTQPSGQARTEAGPLPLKRGGALV
jgi:hypothetical protein